MKKVQGSQFKGSGFKGFEVNPEHETIELGTLLRRMIS